MANFYCEYCGTKSASISNLTSGACVKHPNGSYKGKHKLYEGSEKNEYFCKFCGNKSSTLSNLTSGACVKHPNGSYKGSHSPAL